MKSNLLFLILFYSILLSNAQDIPENNLYFGQTPPTDTPEKFAPDFITGYVHGRIAISPNGDEIFWVTNPSTERIYDSTYKDGSWSSTALAPFTQNKLSNNHGNPTFSPDGNRIYFYSDMSGGLGSIDTWYAERTNNGWTQPINVGEPYNTPNIDFSPLFTNTGNAYYLGYSGSYATVGLKYTFNDNIFSSPTSMEILPEYGPWLSLFYSAEDDYVVFAKGENSDLYVRFKDSEGNWGTPISLGDKINSDQWERFPVVSPDGKYLFFTRGGSSVSNLYWVSTQVIENLRIPNSTNLLLNEKDIKIYPNPASHEIRIEGLSTKNTGYQLIKMDGSIQKQGMLKSTSIDISNFTPGIYLLRFDFKNTSFTKQVIIQ